jgi:hypothetical protein
VSAEAVESWEERLYNLIICWTSKPGFCLIFMQGCLTPQVALIWFFILPKVYEDIRYLLCSDIPRPVYKVAPKALKTCLLGRETKFLNFHLMSIKKHVNHRKRGFQLKLRVLQLIRTVVQHLFSSKCIIEPSVSCLVQHEIFAGSLFYPQLKVIW